MSELEILDPTAGNEASHWSLAGPIDLARKGRLGLLDISKPQGDLYLDTLARLLADRGQRVSRYRKVTMARPAQLEQVREIALHCDAVVIALAD